MDIDAASDAIAEQQYNAANHINLFKAMIEMGLEDDEMVIDAFDNMISVVQPPVDEWLEVLAKLHSFMEPPNFLQILRQSRDNMHSTEICLYAAKYLVGIETQKLGDGGQDTVLKELKTCADSVKYDMGRGYDVWSVYIGYAEDKLGLEQLQMEYFGRLSIPHVQIQATFERYSQFVSQRSDQLDYEQQMVQANKIFNTTKNIVEKRSKWEDELAANESVDLYARYIEWEQKRPIKQQLTNHIISLYERALSRYQLPEIWEEYLFFSESSSAKAVSLDISSLVERAVRACPSSGMLWGYRVRFASQGINEIATEAKEALGESKNDLECVERAKLLRYSQLGDVEHVMGMFATIDSPGPELLTTMTEFCCKYNEGNFVALARDLYSRHDKSTQRRVWTKRIEWEKQIGEHKMIMDVYNKAYSCSLDMDWPDEILQDFVDYADLHLEPHAALQIAAKVRRRMKQLNARRAAVPEEVEVLEQEQNSESQKKRPVSGDGPADYSEEPVRKKPKSGQQHQRDREHCEVLVSNLAKGTTETDLRNLFDDCGDIVAISMKQGDGTATVEFAEREAALSGLTKDLKVVNESTISVTSGEATTLWVTNFPAKYTAQDIQTLFGEHGKILDVRFPSQRFKSRRFCYVQFRDSIAAHAAIRSLNGKVLSSDSASAKDSEHGLVVKLSDPSKKTERTDNAEVIIKSIDFTIDEPELRKLLEPHGQVDRLKLPRNHKSGKNKLHDGYAFVTMHTVSSAQAVVHSLNGYRLGSRNLAVTLKHQPGHHQNRASTIRQDMSRTITVYNVDDTVSESQLQSALGDNISSVVIDRGNQSARIEYIDAAASGQAALAIEGKMLANRKLSLTASNKPSTLFMPRSVRK